MTGPDIITFLVDEMPLMSKSVARASRSTEWWQKNSSLYDDAPGRLPPHHNQIYKGRPMPDQVAQAAYERGLLPEPSVSDLWAAIKTASETRGKGRKRAAGEASAEDREIADFEQRQDFVNKATNDPFVGDPVELADVHPGDKIQADGEVLTVKYLDTRTNGVVLEDGTRWGRQRLDKGETVCVESYTPKEEAGPGDRGQETGTSKPEFTLAPAESVAEQQARLDAVAAAKARQAERDKLADLRAKPLRGTAGDLGQGDLLAGPQDLFAPPGPHNGVDAQGQLREGDNYPLEERKRKETHARQAGQLQFDLFAQQVIATATAATAVGNTGRVNDFLHVGVTLELEGRLRTDLQHTRILARTISEALIRYGGTEVVGKEVHSAADLALLGQFFRHPQFEVLHWILTRGGKVVGRYAVSARSVDTTYLLANGDTLQTVADLIAKTGADGFWLLHNHPSGDPTPSGADLIATTKIAGTFPNHFLGHVVINYRKYSSITETGDYQQRERCPRELVRLGNYRTGGRVDHRGGVVRAVSPHLRRERVERGLVARGWRADWAGARPLRGVVCRLFADYWRSQRVQNEKTGVQRQGGRDARCTDAVELGRNGVYRGYTWGTPSAGPGLCGKRD